MVRPRSGTRRGAWRRLLGVSAAGALLMGCAGDAVLVPKSEEPFLYLVLNQRTPNEHMNLVGQFAFLLTSGSPAEPPRFRCAERFRMRRASDGAEFGWRGIQCSGETGGYPGVSFNDANYFLPDTATAQGLGAQSLRPGEAYEIQIETGGRVLRGRAGIPAPFTVSLGERDGRRVLAWPKVAGAAGYQIKLPDDELVTQPDTSYTLPSEASRGSRIEVRALDANLWEYANNARVARAGIDTGYGLFGAITTARLTL
ncbi:MAG: hypothetical protein M3P24_01725 [Gemmatimonadota bacterium]|nr:hypothetical protein [Gemmatimonadota bacterium]